MARSCAFLPPLLDTLMVTINALIGQLNRIKCSLAQSMARKIIISHISQNFYTLELQVSFKSGEKLALYCLKLNSSEVNCFQVN